MSKIYSVSSQFSQFLRFPNFAFIFPLNFREVPDFIQNGNRKPIYKNIFFQKPRTPLEYQDPELEMSSLLISNIKNAFLRQPFTQVLSSLLSLFVNQNFARLIILIPIISLNLQRSISRLLKWDKFRFYTFSAFKCLQNLKPINVSSGKFDEIF